MKLRTFWAVGGLRSATNNLYKIVIYLERVGITLNFKLFGAKVEHPNGCFNKETSPFPSDFKIKTYTVYVRKKPLKCGTKDIAM